MNSRFTRALPVAGLITGLLLLGACSSMSAKECSVIDWRSIGYEDGVKGFSGDHIREYREACAKYGVAGDLASYQAGRAAGLQEFCQPSNGYRIGAQGYDYRGVCPAPLENAFLAAYQSGHELHMYEWRAENAAEQLSQARLEREQTQQNLLQSGATVIMRDVPVEARAEALLDSNQLLERGQRLDNRIAQLEQEKQGFDQDLAAYRSRVAANHY